MSNENEHRKNSVVWLSDLCINQEVNFFCCVSISKIVFGFFSCIVAKSCFVSYAILDMHILDFVLALCLCVCVCCKQVFDELISLVN